MAAPKKRPRPSGRPVAPGGAPDQSLLREIGNRIRTARVAADLSQESAAARAGIDYKRWQRLEQGVVNPTARTLLRVADAVDTTFWDLLSSGQRTARRLPRARSEARSPRQRSQKKK